MTSFTLTIILASRCSYIAETELCSALTKSPHKLASKQLKKQYDLFNSNEIVQAIQKY